MRVVLNLSLRCPHCGRLNDAVNGVGEARGTAPDAEAVSLCVGCGKWSVFEDDFVGLRQRIPTDDEWAEMQQDETVQKASAAWQQTFGKRPRTGSP